MKRVTDFLLPLVVSVSIVLVSFNLGAADSPAPGDAGVALALASSGSATLPPAPPQAPTLHDPTTDPSAYLSDVETAKKIGYAALAIVLAVGVLEALAALGRWKSYPKLAWLGKGRASVAIGGGIVVLLEAYKVLASGGSWGSVASAAVLAGFAFWHQAGTDPEKS